MMPVFSSVCSFSFVLAVLSVGSMAAQDGGSFAMLDIDFGSSTSRVWRWYVVRDRTTVRASWMNPQDGEHIYRITKLSASSTSRARGVVYSPGCALQTFDIAIQDVRSYRNSFPCEAISQVEIHGSVPPLGRLYAHDIRIEAKYVADWAPEFVGYDDGTTTEIPLGRAATLDDQNQFRLSIPDLLKDKLACSTIHAGEVRIWVRDQVSGRIVDQWRLTSRNPKLRPTRLGGIPIACLNRTAVYLLFARQGRRMRMTNSGLLFGPI
jgi:hypothetical protein